MLESWDALEEKNDLMTMAMILAYDQIRNHEEFEMKKAEIEALIGSMVK